MSKTTLKIHPGSHKDRIDRALKTLEDEQILPRIWEHDHTVWKPDPKEILNRLGWLRIANKIRPEIPRILSLADNLRGEGFNQVLLLGMGGSSLAPEVFRNTFGVKEGYLDLAVLDSTDPDHIQGLSKSLDYSKTIFIVSTKSGGTVETLSFFKFFYHQVKAKFGTSRAGSHFIAITDPGSRLETLAQRLNFREIFLNDPNIGGRFSALSFFGLVPAGLLGVDLNKLLARAIEIADSDDQGAILGTALGVLAAEGRDKVTFFIVKELESFGDWVEQLIAESTGKEGKGLLPIVREPLGQPEVYGPDRVFVTLGFEGASNNVSLNPLLAAGHPAAVIRVNDIYDLGGQFFLWELATSVASYWLEVNPFDQPNVESAKVLARNMVSEFQKTGSLPEMQPSPPNPENLQTFLSNSKPGDYISLQAYLKPSAETREILQELRINIRDRYKLATTLGFGPRFLHSTGQLHKGDSGNGLFVQFTSESKIDVDIPDEGPDPGSSISFGTLKMAQALGDGMALRNENRRFIHFHLGVNFFKALDTILGSKTNQE